MELSHYDVAIVGAGPTGSALAILLARLAPDPSRIILFQSDQQSRYGRSVKQDPRVIAVNEGTRVALEDLNVWSPDAAAIDTIHISQSHRLGRTLLRAQEMAVPALGYVVRYASLYDQLLQAASATGITVRAGDAATMTQVGPDVRIEHEGQTFLSHLGIRADGQRKEVQREAYDQVALVGQATVSQPRVGWAFERFTRQGPLAVLPHPDSPHHQSIVYCCSPSRAQQLLGLDGAAFAKAMQHDFGERLGTLTPQQPFASFPLYKSFDDQPVQGSVVAIGNAAQTLHPVAGQGLNLALRDAQTLAHCLRQWLAQGDAPVARPLDLYARLRRQDRVITAGMTDFLSRSFATGLAPVEHAAGLALLGLDLTPPVRRAFGRLFLQGLRA